MKNKSYEPWGPGAVAVIFGPKPLRKLMPTQTKDSNIRYSYHKLSAYLSVWWKSEKGADWCKLQLWSKCVCHKMGVSSIPKGSSLCFHVNGHFLVSNAKLSGASFVSSEALKCWPLASWCHPTWGSISRKMSNPLVNYHNYGKSPFFMGKNHYFYGDFP